jgi:hypothetical protein
MEIVRVYETSKGLFWTFHEANKKKNRAKDFDRWGLVGYEPVVEKFLLKSVQGYFSLTQVTDNIRYE